MSRPLLCLLLVPSSFALAACGGSDGLTARGSVTSDARGAFDFAVDTRLDGPPEGLDELFTGECELAELEDELEDADDAYGVVVTVRRGTAVDDRGLASVTVMQRTDLPASDAQVEAVFGVTDFRSEGAGECAVEIPYVEDDSGTVGLTGTCDVADVDGNRERLSIELDLTGCTVLDDD